MQSPIERVDPRDDQQRVLLSEHVVRYVYAGEFVKGKRVLDAGCGEGYGLAILRQAGASTAIGVDIATETLHEAHRRYPRLLAGVAGDVTRLPFRDHSFDVITCFEVLEHLPELQQHALLTELHRVLIPAGTLLISTPNRELYTPRVSLEIMDRNPFHAHELTLEEFQDGMKRLFTHVAIQGQTPVPNGFVPGEGDADTVRYHAVGPIVYRVELTSGACAPCGRLTTAPSPGLSLYLVAVCCQTTPPSRPSSRGLIPLTISSAELTIFSLWARWGMYRAAETAFLHERYGETVATLASMEAEIATLTQDLDASTAWGVSLDTERAGMRAFLAASQERALRQIWEQEATIADLSARADRRYGATIAERDVTIAERDATIAALESERIEAEERYREQAAYAAWLKTQVEHLNEVRSVQSDALRSINARLSRVAPAIRAASLIRGTARNLGERLRHRPPAG